MTYKKALLQAMDGWSKHPIEDEWLFDTFRKQFVKPMSTVEAFESIGETVDILLCQSNESIAIEVLNTIYALAGRSNTTEIPPKLAKHKADIEKQFEGFGSYAQNALKELFRFYRIN